MNGRGGSLGNGNSKFRIYRCGRERGDLVFLYFQVPSDRNELGDSLEGFYGAVTKTEST